MTTAMTVLQIALTIAFYCISLKVVRRDIQNEFHVIQDSLLESQDLVFTSNYFDFDPEEYDHESELDSGDYDPEVIRNISLFQ